MKGFAQSNVTDVTYRLITLIHIMPFGPRNRSQNAITVKAL